MKKTILLLILLCHFSIAYAVTISVDAKANSGSTPASIQIEAGRYHVSAIAGGWTPWREGYCSGDGCWTGSVHLNTDISGNGVSLHSYFYPTKGEAIANTSQSDLCIPIDDKILAYVGDCGGCYADNRGGVTVQLEKIAETNTSYPLLNSNEESIFEWSETEDMTSKCTDINGTVQERSENCQTLYRCVATSCTQPDTKFLKKADNQRIAFKWKETEEDRSSECSAITDAEIQERKVDCKKEYRCLITTDACPTEQNEQVSSYISPRDGVFHEDIEIAGVPFGLHYSSANLEDVSIAHGWSLSSHARLVGNRLYYGSGSIYVVDTSVKEDGFTVIKSGTNELLFNANGVLQTTRDLYTKETKTTFSYDFVGNLVTITDIYGQITSIERDDAGIATAIVGPAGKRTLLNVNSKGDLVEVQYEDATSYTFEYEKHLMTKEFEPNGNAFEHIFDGSGKVIKVIDAEQGVWQFNSLSQTGFGTHIVTRASGDVVTYKNHLVEDGILRTEKLLATGEVVRYENAIDDTMSSSTTCGMKSTNYYRKNADGSLYKDAFTQKRVLEKTIQTTPSGLRKVTLFTKNYTISNGKVSRIEKTTTTNNKPFTNLRDYAAFKASSTTAENKTSTIDYDTHNQNIQTMKPYGLLKTSYVYDTQGRVLESHTGERVTHYSYDSRGNLESSTNPLHQKTTYSYDERDRLTTTTYADGHTLHYSYDSNGNMTLLTTPTPTDHTFGYNGVNKRTNYDSPLGKSTTYTYDKQRRVTQVTKPSGKSIDTTYTHGRITEVTTPEGTTHYSYTCQNNPQSITKPSTGSGSDEKMGYTYDGTLLTSMIQTGVLNETIAFSYNNDFLVSSMTYAGATTNYSYNKDGELTQAGDFSLSRTLNTTLSQTLTDGTYTQKTHYNGYGEVASQEDGLFGYTLEHNTNGQIIRKTETLSGMNTTSTYSYDDRGRLIEVNTTAQTPRENSSDQNDWHVYDQTPEGAQITTVYDELKGSSVIAFEGDRTRNGYRLGYTGDSHPNSWNSTDTQITWSMRYDQSYMVYISTMTTKGHRYLYYTASNTDKGMHPNGRYIHHGLGSETRDDAWHSITRDLAADLAEYEPDNELLSVNGFLIRGSGRVDDIATSTTTQEHYAYDANGNRQSATIHSITTTASYTLDDQLVVYGDNTYEYDDDDYLTTQTTPRASYTYGYGSQGALREVAITTGTHSDTWHVYDQTPEGAQITTVYDELKGSSVIAFEGDRTRNGYRLGYTGDSHPNSWNSTDTQITWSMRYDQSYMVYISTMTTKGHRYLYYTASNTDKGMHPNGRYIHHGLGSETRDDAWHSITRDLAADLAEYEPDNELLSVNGFLIRGSGRVDDIATIDTDGARTTRDNAQTPHETIITYEHNALNQRVAKLVDGEVVEKYLWANLTTLLAIYDKDDNLIQRFEYANGRMPVAMTMGTQKYYLHYDQVGSLRAISRVLSPDNTNKLIKEITYDTYGNILKDTNPSFKVPFGFAGGLYDADTKLTRFGYRDYDAYTGKWTAKDPIGFDGGDSNLYGYVLGDPVNFVDPMGLFDPVADAILRPVDHDLPGGPGLFGPICGSGSSAPWVPDFFPDSCSKHDKCYETCGKTKLECDLELAEPYGFSLRNIFKDASQKAYDDAQKHCKQNCEESSSW